MATSTTNYQLRKPAPADTVNVTTDISDNMDDIDTELKRVDDATLGAEVSRWTRILDDAGTYLTTSGTDQLNLAKLAVENINVLVSRTYNFMLKLYIESPTANDDFFIRVRKDDPSTGTILEEWPWILQRSGLDHAATFFGSWVATGGDVDGDFYVTVQRVDGTGTIAIQGDRKTKFKMWVDPPTTSNTVES